MRPRFKTLSCRTRERSPRTCRERTSRRSGSTSPTPTPPTTTTNNNLDPHPLIHFDPLDEWYLDRVPSLPLHSLPAGVRPITDGADPFALAKSDLDTLSASIRRDLIGRDHADHPVLAKAAAHFFELGAQGGGKKVRPMMVMLVADQENHRVVVLSIMLHGEHGEYVFSPWPLI